MDDRATTEQRAEPAHPAEARTSWGTLFVRWGIGGIMVLAGVVCLIVSPGGFGTEGFSMAVGGGLSVIMLNWLYRLGASGDREREQEEAARAYLDRHGHWPDEAPRPARPVRGGTGARNRPGVSGSGSAPDRGSRPGG